MDSFDKQTQATLDGLQYWLNQDEEGRRIMALFLTNPEGEAQTLAAWLQAHREQAPPQLATYVTGGQVDKIVNIARAGVVFVQQATEPPSPHALYQLLVDIADFTGRVEEQAEAISLLEQAAQGKGTVIWAVAGMAGVGKSALALHVAHSVKDSFPDAQFYVNLRGADGEPMDPTEALKAFLEAMGVKDESVPKDLEGIATLYRSLLINKRALVLLDNAYDERQVRPLLPASATCAVIITSRRRLSALEGAKILDLGILSEESALSLLAKLAGPERLVDNNEAAKRVVSLCGYLPLAIRIAARELSKPHRNVKDYAMQLANERTRLTRLQLGDLEVRSTFALSYRDLSEDDAHLFRLLGLLDRPDFFLVVPAAVWGKSMDEGRDVLDRLADAQLVEPDAKPPEGWEGAKEYRIHDLIRLFAIEELAKESSDEVRAAARRRAEEAWSLNGLATFAFLKSIEAEESSWQAAIRNYNKLIKSQRRLGISDSRSEDTVMKNVAGLYARLGLSYAEKGEWTQAIRKFKNSIKTFGGPTLEDNPGLALAEQGIAYAKEGRTEKALEQWRGAVAQIDPAFNAHQNLKLIQKFLIAFDEKQNLSRSLGEQAFALLEEEKRLDEAMQLFKQQEDLIIRLNADAKDFGIVSIGDSGDGKDVSLLENYSGQIFILGKHGDVQEAAELFRKVQQLASELDDERSRNVEEITKAWLANAYRECGASAWEENKPDEAKEMLALALQLYRELKDTEAVQVLETALKELEDY